MSVATLAVLTEKRYLKPDNLDLYINNILTEDLLIQTEIEKLGISCARVSWDDNFNPSDFQFALFRTTWNYFDHLSSFNYVNGLFE